MQYYNSLQQQTVQRSRTSTKNLQSSLKGSTRLSSRIFLMTRTLTGGLFQVRRWLAGSWMCLQQKNREKMALVKNGGVHCWSVPWSQHLFLEKPDVSAWRARIRRKIQITDRLGSWLKRHRFQISKKGFLFFTVCLFCPLHDWWQAFCRQLLRVWFQIKLNKNSWDQVTVSYCGPLLAVPRPCQIKSQHSYFILSPRIT